MNKGMTIVLSFTAGMAAGIFTGKKMLEQHYEQRVEEEIESVSDLPKIIRMNDVEMPLGLKRVIFNPPATIVLWDDGSKTVVKCGENEAFDREKGLAMAIAKRTNGNTGAYFEVFRKYCHTDEEIQEKAKG